MKKLVLLCALLLAVASASVANFRLKYADVVSGKRTLVQSDGRAPALVAQMYSDFLATFRQNDLPLQRFLGTAPRFEAFKRTLAQVQSHNRDGRATWRMGINKFSDLTWEEFAEYQKLGAPQECNALSRARLPGVDEAELALVQQGKHREKGWDWN